LGFVQVVFLCKLEVLQEFGVHSLHLDLLLGVGLASGIPVMFSVLIMIGMILGLGHVENYKK
jgi:hypothetical protein